MTPARRKLWTLVLYVVCAAAPIAAGAACWSQWSQWSPVRDALAAAGAADRSVQDAQARFAGLAADQSALSVRNEALSRDLATLQNRQMPGDAESVRRSTLDILSLAQRCGLNVEQINRAEQDVLAGPDGDYAVVQAGARDQAATFLNRFSRGSVCRPLVRIQGRGDYAGIHQFFTGLKDLHWPVTTVQFEVTQPQHAAAAPSPESTGPAQAPPPDGRLHIDLILAL